MKQKPFHQINIYIVFLTGLLLFQGMSVSGQKVDIAMAQIFCLDGDRSGNLRRIENAVIEAKSMGADIVCFPETSIYGWINPVAHERAYPIPGEDSKIIAEMAKKYQLYICIGLAEKEGDLLYDAAILVNDRGEILIKHRKRNTIKELMDPPYASGDEVHVAQTPFGKIGLLICADSFDKSSLQEMKLLSPDILLVPYGWANVESAWPGHAKELEQTVINAAQKINCYVVGTDLVGQISQGPWKGMVYGGASISVDPSGKILTLCKDRDRDIQLVRISAE